MPRAADGTMSLSGIFAIANTIPVSSTINGYISDITTELTDSWSRSGKGAALAHLSMGNFKMTLLADGVALTDAANVKQVQNGTVAWADGGGTVDAITAAYAPAVTAVVDGMRLRVRATGANATTTPTFSPSALTARVIKKLNGQALLVGDIAGDEHDLDLTYVATGTYWNLNNPKFAAASGATSVTSLTVSESVAFTGDLTPPQITADVNDYAPTGHAAAHAFRLSSDNLRAVTGLAGGTDGREVEIYNIGLQNIDLPHNSGSSSAANRFFNIGEETVRLFANNLGVSSGYTSAIYRWDTTLNGWLQKGGGSIPCTASSVNMEAATSGWRAVTPAFQHNHPGHPKFWAYVTVSAGTPTVQTSYNVTSITDTAVGRLTVTIATDFSSANWSPIVANNTVNSGTNPGISTYISVAAGSVVLECQSNSGTFADPPSWSVMGLGDQ